MMGAIIGNIMGSRFKFNNYSNKNDCSTTDDSIMRLQ